MEIENIEFEKFVHNSYFQKYLDEFKQIINVVIKNSHGYSRIISSNKKLNDFLNDLFPQLKLNSISTKCNWLLNDIHDFPTCQYCGKNFTHDIPVTKQYPKLCRKCNLSHNKEITLKRSETFKKHCEEDKNFLKNINNKVRNTKLKRHRDEKYNNIEKQKKTKIEKYGDENFTNQDKAKQTKLKKYGNSNYVNNEKRKLTCIEKYGCENPFQDEEIKNKIKQTNLKKYGVGSIFQVNEIKDKIKQTNIKKYGCENPFASDYIKAKIYETNIEKYGYKSPMQNSEIKKKAKEKYQLVCLERYNTKSYFSSEQFKKFCLEKYGCENPMQNNDIRKIAQNRYIFKEISFDSAPEIALFIWLTDKKIPFEYQPNITFKYEHEGKKHVYMPDFLIDGQLIEIKGSQFLKEDGTWKNPYDRNQDALYEAKHQCLLKNNVKILYDSDYREYLDYVDKKYGRNYLNRFKNKKDVTE